MTRWETVVALCQYLRAGLLNGAPPRPAVAIRWERLVEASSHHYVTPALAWCLRNQTDIPPEFRDYFAAALAFNRQRNEYLTKHLACIVAALNAIEIEPVLLKGAARLIDGIYPVPEVRFLGDIDVLIPADRFAAAVTALKAIGFEAPAGSKINPTHPHPLPMLIQRDTGAGVELHVGLAVPPYDAIVSPDWLSEHTRLFPLQGVRVRLPDATRSAAHNIVHDQLHHENYRWRRVQLRQLLDLAMIRLRYETTIDWAALDYRFCSIGMGQALATYLELAELLFGQSMPPLSHAPRAGALAAFRRSIEWPAIRGSIQLAEIPINKVLALCHKPRRILELLSLRAWMGAFRSAMSTLDTKW